MAVTELATLRARDGQGELLAAGLVEAGSVLEAAEGCLGVRVMRCVEDPDAFSLIVGWDSVAAHGAFATSPGLDRFRDLIGELLAPERTSAHYEDLR